MRAMVSLDSTDEEILAEMRKIREMYILKHTMRYESVRDMSAHTESVAEHLFGMNVLVQYFLPLEDSEGALDRIRIHELILYHEIGEIETGDIISHKKTDEQKTIERLAAERVSKRIPESLAERALARFQEYEAGETAEAAFTIAIDKIEPMFEMFDESRWKYFKSQKMNKDISVGKKRRTTENYPYMRRFLDVWTEYMVSNNVFAE
jgi:putative hydrolase of HD superfamily